MSQNAGTLVIAPIRPNDSADTYPTAWAREIKGGWKSVANLAARNALALELNRLEEGCVCWQNDTGVLYEWTGVAWSAITLGGGSPTGAAGGDLTGTYPSPTLAAIGAGATVGGASAIPVITYDTKGRITGSSAVTPVVAEQTLAQQYETIAPPSGVTSYTILVATANNGVISMGGTGAGKYGKYDWTTQTWTEGTISGATAATYGWAFYCPGADVIWAGSTGSALTHVINPSTMVATDITAAAGVIGFGAYNAFTGKVYGSVTSSSTIKEMDPATGVVSRSYNATTFVSGYSGIVCNQTTGMIWLYANNTGVGNHILSVDGTAFNAVASDVVLTGFSNSLAGTDRIVYLPNENKVVVISGSLSKGISYSCGPGTFVFIQGRIGAGGNIAYSTLTNKLYVLCLTNKMFVQRIDSTTAFLACQALVGLVSGTAATSGQCIACGYDGYVYVMMNTRSIIRLIP